MGRLSDGELKALGRIQGQLRGLDRAVKRVGVKVPGREATSAAVNAEAGRLAKHCTQPNRGLCNEALRQILLLYNPTQVGWVLRQLKAANYPPEVAVAYMYAAALMAVGRASFEGVVVRDDGSIDVEPVLTGQYTIEHARRVIPLNEPASWGFEALIKRLLRRI